MFQCVRLGLTGWLVRRSAGVTKYRQRTATINQDTVLVNLGSLDHSVKVSYHNKSTACGCQRSAVAAFRKF